MHVTLANDYEVYFEADDEAHAEELSESIAGDLLLELDVPRYDRVDGVLDLSYDGPNEASINDGPWEE
jgi:hypothetical protein